MLFLAMVLTVLSNGVYGKVESKQISLEVDRRLKLLNKPAVKSIMSEDGDIIDCVDIYKQPAFDHPALRNHTIQMRPSFDPETETTTKQQESSLTVVSQLWQRSGSCPEGTIPIRRIRKHDLLRTTSLENYGRKSPQIDRALNKTDYHDDHFAKLNNTGTYFPQFNRSKAVVFTQGYNYIGAKGDINVWNPNVESWDEYSTAQIWLKNGPSDDFESVESGWVTDSSQKTGCFDLICSGFVQTGHEISLGASIEPVSYELGPQYQITVYIFKDPVTSNWWLQYGNKINIGYWPSSLFSLLSHSSTFVEWGGEVYSSKVGMIAPHTGTAMGSGDFAEGLFGFSSFITKIRIRDYSLSLKYPEWVYTYGDEYNCYNVYNYRQGYPSEPEFYFGGPGRNPRCP
ncbi:hypothetical protein HHK36_021723 [Tetracentron sinense]|uniref:Neprosin PEP catalytic domain-containing protein n=1 Tax=Tetracentron sinense TaxID=13715 RepID=A0A834YQA0_TETSI|nr:hypothetical protein HHK36_021723 [Tetracentron sinense]